MPKRISHGGRRTNKQLTCSLGWLAWCWNAFWFKKIKSFQWTVGKWWEQYEKKGDKVLCTLCFFFQSKNVFFFIALPLPRNPCNVSGDGDLDVLVKAQIILKISTSNAWETVICNLRRVWPQAAETCFDLTFNVNSQKLKLRAPF